MKQETNNRVPMFEDIPENASNIRLGHLANTKKKNAYRQEAILGVLFAMPAILGFIIFTLGPMLASLILSFTDYAVFNKLKFVGFENYINLFNGDNPFFYKSILVTFYYVALSVPLGLTFHFFLAVLMNRKIKFRGIYRAVFYLPTILPIAATCTVWMWLFNPDFGLLNYLLGFLGIPKLMWIGSEAGVVPSIVLTAVWIAGNTMVTFLAGLQDIPRQMLEAVDVDGGNAFHKLRHITIPMVSSTIFFNFIMGIINGFQVIVQPMMMTAGGPNNSSLFYGMFLYKEAFEFSRMGSACAIAWVLFIIIMIFTGLTFKSSPMWVYYEGEVKGK